MQKNSRRGRERRRGRAREATGGGQNRPTEEDFGPAPRFGPRAGVARIGQ